MGSARAPAGAAAVTYARMALTLEAVLALAPDGASAQAARGLASPGTWPRLGANAAAVWGECQGSGAKPYQTQVDLAVPAFTCTCPSRKFPCKHALALLMLQAQDPSRFTSADAPAWVSAWLASRADKAGKKVAREARTPAVPADPEAAAKREAQRWVRIERAAQELQRWLADQMARGLGAIGDEARDGWLTMAKRMVDASAPGLGQRIYQAADGLHRGEDWPERTLHRLGLLQLACEALQRRAQLPPDVQADLRTLAGWPHEKADVLAGAGVRVPDRWTVLGLVTEERDDNLTERRVWLHGEHSGRRAWLLDHAFGGRGFADAWVVGTAIEASMVFFPGRSGLRALAADVAGTAGAPSWPTPALDDEWRSIAARVAAYPWINLQPLVLDGATPVRRGEDDFVVAGGRAWPMRAGEGDVWRLLAASGGHPLPIAGEWNGRTFAPLAAWRDASGGPLWQRRIA
jgi:hypothetical protein